MMRRNALILLLAALALAALPAAAQDAVGKALLFAEAADLAELAAEARASGASVRELPGALELDADVAAELEDRALRLEILPDPRLVQMAAGEIDLRQHPLDLAALPAGAAPFIVAYDGVPDAAFVASLAAAGAQLVGPLPPSSFLVRGDAAAAGRVAGLPGVAALGAFDPSFKLSRRLEPGPLGSRAEIVLFAGAGADEVLAELEALGIEAEILAGSGRVVLAAELPVAARGRLAALPAVEAIDAAPEAALYNNEIRVLMQTTKAHYLANQAFYNPVYGIGVWGASQVVTAADTGVDNHEVFAGPGKIVPTTASGPCVTLLNDAANHGTGVAATLLGDRISAGGAFGTANNLDGLAIRSRLVMQDIEDHLGNFCPPADPAVDLFIPAWLGGSLIHTNSWGHNAIPNVPLSGSYSWRSQRIDEYLRFPLFREHSVLFAVGNAGAHWSTGAYLAYTLSDEAHAKNAIAVGGSWNGNGRDIMYKFSSHGPANDCLGVPCAGLKRVKPDVVAPADKVVDTADNWTPTTYSTFSGTSIAAPAVAGAAALVRDYFAQGKYPNDPSDPPLGGPPSSALVKAMLVNATVPLYDPTAYQGNLAQGLTRGAYPNYDQGYGRPTLDNVLEPAGYRKLKVFEDATTTSVTGDVWTRNVQLVQKWGGTCNNLRVTLVWNDEIGTLAAGPKLVNDLDLEVTYMGTTVRGNHRLTGGAWDRVNNVEDVFLPKGHVAPFTVFPVTIRVYGRSVPAGPQPWAVVLTYGSCADQIPCPPPPVAGGCYRGPGDTVPGSTWTPPVPGCKDQTYSTGEFAGGMLPYPYCKPPVIIVDPAEPHPTGPIGPIGSP